MIPKNTLYDYLVVGAGSFASICAQELQRLGSRCLVIDRREHIGGGCYAEIRDNINVHVYWQHISHTSNELVWNNINKVA